jgi:hypothetical protein
VEPLPASPGTDSVTSHDELKAIEKVFQHPAYEDWEVRKAINVIRLLKQWRDEARANGQIDW